MSAPHIFEADFAPGEVVYLRIGDEAGMVTAVNFSGMGASYWVMWGNRQETRHYAFELAREPNFAAAASEDRPR